MNNVKGGNFEKNTVEIIFKGVKKRVSKEVANALKKPSKAKK